MAGRATEQGATKASSTSGSALLATAAAVDREVTRWAGLEPRSGEAQAVDGAMAAVLPLIFLSYETADALQGDPMPTRRQRSSRAPPGVFNLASPGTHVVSLDDWEAMAQKVFDKKETPKRAEAWSQKNCHENPFVNYITTWNILTSLEHWPLNLAVIWIAFRDETEVPKQWDRQFAWRSALWSETNTYKRKLSMPLAAQDLRENLLEGRLIAAASQKIDGISSEGAIHISKAEWIHLNWSRSDCNITTVASDNGSRSYTDVTVSRNDVLRFWTPRKQPRAYRDREKALMRSFILHFLLHLEKDNDFIVGAPHTTKEVKQRVRNHFGMPLNENRDWRPALAQWKITAPVGLILEGGQKQALMRRAKAADP